MNPMVYSEIVLLHAQAQRRVERLEAKHRSTPIIQGNSNSRLALFRQLTEQKSQAASWYAVMTSALSLSDDEFDERSVPGE